MRTFNEWLDDGAKHYVKRFVTLMRELEENMQENDYIFMRMNMNHIRMTVPSLASWAGVKLYDTPMEILADFYEEEGEQQAADYLRRLGDIFARANKMLKDHDTPHWTTHRDL